MVPFVSLLISSASLVARLEEAAEDSSQGRNFMVSLHKDARTGLGLTLVDGDLAGVHGIYVKSVTEGGAGQAKVCVLSRFMNLQGVSVGDRLLAVNGDSLEGKDRHAAVALVKDSGDVVELRLLRLDAVARAQQTKAPKGSLCY